MRNVRVSVDAGCVNFFWTDSAPRNERNDFNDAVFATLAEAKQWAIDQAVPERDQWAEAVRSARLATLNDVMGPPNG